MQYVQWRKLPQTTVTKVSEDGPSIFDSQLTINSTREKPMATTTAPDPAFYTLTRLRARKTLRQKGVGLVKRQLAMEGASDEVIDLATQKTGVYDQVAAFHISQPPTLPKIGASGPIITAIGELITAIDTFLESPAGDSFLAELATALLAAI
jgi:hypothetical protein